MINFIILHDSDFWLNYIESRISKLVFNKNLNYKIYKFNNYDNKFQNITTENLENKFYILNIKNNGLNIANKIRKFDKNSKFIFFTNNQKELYLKSYSINSIEAMGFFDKNEFKLFDKIILNFINDFFSNNFLKIKTISSFNLIKFQDILFIETKNRKTIIHTKETIIKTSKNLRFFENKILKEYDFFVKTHRACIVNLNNVMCFNFKEKEILFFNNKKCNLLSKGYKNIIKNKINFLFNINIA